MARDYELTLIVDSQQGDDAAEKVVEKYTAFLKEHGIEEMHVNRRGVRKLAYAIRKLAQADYTFVQFAADTNVVSEMDRQIRLDQSVLRHLFVRSDPVKVAPEEPVVKGGEPVEAAAEEEA